MWFRHDFKECTTFTWGEDAFTHYPPHTQPRTLTFSTLNSTMGRRAGPNGLGLLFS